MLEKTLSLLISEIRNRKLKLVLAESCTGGLISSLLTAEPGVSDIYNGAIISYSNEIKETLLGVDPQILKEHGAVSQPTVLAMAEGACRVLQGSCSIAVTGIAGPTGGTADKPVGTVWMAAQGPGFVKCERKIFSGDRQSIQRQSAEFSMLLLLNALQQDSRHGK